MQSHSVENSGQIATATDDAALRVLAIDFEASCLPWRGRSFPIEVGLANLDGQTRSWLIKPDASWDSWDWSTDAERLHTVDRATLSRQGLPAGVVAADLMKAAAGHRIVSDSACDTYWLETLFHAAGHAVCPLSISHVSDVMAEQAIASKDVISAIKACDGLAITRHRAAGDALWLATFLSMTLHPEAHLRSTRPIRPA